MIYGEGEIELIKSLQREMWRLVATESRCPILPNWNVAKIGEEGYNMLMKMPLYWNETEDNREWNAGVPVVRGTYSLDRYSQATESIGGRNWMSVDVIEDFTKSLLQINIDKKSLQILYPSSYKDKAEHNLLMKGCKHYWAPLFLERNTVDICDVGMIGRTISFACHCDICLSCTAKINSVVVDRFRTRWFEARFVVDEKGDSPRTTIEKKKILNRIFHIRVIENINLKESRKNNWLSPSGAFKMLRISFTCVSLFLTNWYAGNIYWIQKEKNWRRGKIYIFQNNRELTQVVKFSHVTHFVTSREFADSNWRSRFITKHLSLCSLK